MPMRVVIDGLPLRGMSVAIVVEHLLEGWMELGTADEVHLVTGPQAELTIPDGVVVHRVELGAHHYLGRMRAQMTVIPRLCRQLDADVMLGVLPSTTVTPLPCPRAVIAYDLRHELRPAQFSRRARLLRKLSYDVGFRQADAIVSISERTRDDLLRSRPWLLRRPVRAAQLGADHVDTWPADPDAPRYALAFGQWGNKNVDLLLEAWQKLHKSGQAMPLMVVGLNDLAREQVTSSVLERDLQDVVNLQPWLSDEEFRSRFASAAMIVFPSDFEGFGLPAVEAMRLGIPVVVTPDPALLEVTGGHAAVMAGWGADELADAVMAARQTSDRELATAKAHASAFTWRRTAERTRAALEEAIASRAKGRHHVGSDRQRTEAATSAVRAGIGSVQGTEEQDDHHDG